MQTIVYQCDTAMSAQKSPNCCKFIGLTFIGNGLAGNGLPVILLR